MAGIQRFITYIYAYEEGKKGANKGFAKVEIRGIDCRMEIHMRDIRRNCKTGEVSLFSEKNGMLESVSIRNMKFTEGRGDFAIAMKTERLNGTECSFQSMEGLLILIDDQSICLSRWKEGNPIEVKAEKIKPWNEQMISKEEVVEVTNTSNNQNEPMKEQENENDDTKLERESRTDYTLAEAAKEPQNINNSAEQMQETIQATEVPMKNIFPQYQWMQIWEELCKTRATFILHQKKEIECVRIELKDLRELPQKYWYFGNNSFLLHGFFNYRYLIIGRIEEDRWFIGVPGVFQPQERVMAAIFGFAEFLPQEAIDLKEMSDIINHFGYWYHVF